MTMKPNTEVPNLDCLTTEDLSAFWSRHKLPAQHADDLFDKPTREEVAALGMLADYARVKKAAMEFRAVGRIDVAIRLESICEEHIYAALPAWAQW